MPTYKDLQDRIALDHLNRFDLIGEVKRAINNSIRAYESYRFYFNQTASAVAVSAGDARIAAPSDLITLDRLQITYSGTTFDMQPLTYGEVREMNATGVTGVPTHYAPFGTQYELAVTPDSAYSLTAYYVHKFPTLSADADSNPWTNDAFNLIAHAATSDLLASALSIEKPFKLKYHQQMLRNALQELQLRNAVRLTTKLQATRF